MATLDREHPAVRAAGVNRRLSMGPTRSGRACYYVPSLPSLMLLAWLAVVSAAQKPTGWNTLNGNPPVIIAKGGFSGLFPDSSSLAYEYAVTTSSRRYTILYCDVRLTKDGVGICLPHVDMGNGTNIADVFPQEKKSYLVNGVPFCGWSSVDYYWSQLRSPLYLKQTITPRTTRFDGMFPLLTVEDMLSNFNPSGTWLNVQHDSFYRQFGLRMRSYIISASRHVDYISSPEVSFLTSILGRVHRRTKLVFRFLDESSLEPSLNVTFGSLLENLTFVKTFASGIIVPKHYIWPVSYDNYLEECSSVVTDAHDAGLEIYAAGFANDLTLSYNYSFDPLAEYFSFIDNDIFSIDGVLTDFPVTASEAIGCFTNLNKSNADHGKPLIISHNGASGDYPGCTDLAYQKAVDDGADVIDCPVQLTKDGIPICMASSNLLDVCYVPGLHSSTTTSNSKTAVASVPGFFTYNFTWHDIVANLQPKISTPFSSSNFFRNPRFATAGNFTRLSDFLDFAKHKDLFGIMITIQPVYGTPEEVALDMLDAIIKALEDAGYSNQQTAQRVLIYSYSSSILMKFKQETKYDLVYDVNGAYEQVAPSGLAVLQQFASAVTLPSWSVINQDNYAFTTNQTEIIQSLQAAGYPVYVYNLQNEFVSQPYDFFADATAQMNTYVQGVGVDGVITDFPATARRYKANTCRETGNNKPGFMAPVRPGGLLKYVNNDTARRQPGLDLPLLTDDEIAEPPLPQAAGSASLSKRTCWILIALSPILFN